ncbi:MAG: DUF4407 domain-containing protein [Oscillatoriales cyanobacterium]|uniref:DUF4407 domain-containing protein n=1 Tax=Microcoleus anatoxicus TaxID=2705319 RepID=UPI0030C9205D|nr:MAG: DUF4407 domain-containing protein [Oscillatoriales cyanobacterium]
MLKIIQKILVYCGGANWEILDKNKESVPSSEKEKSVCPSEKDKYASIGAVVLSTAILASLSGGYAIFTIFESKIIASAIGLFWGSFIFNIDRMFIISMKKDKDNNIMQVILIAAPRIVLGACLGLLISKPIELRFFSKQINEKYYEVKILKIKNNLNQESSELIIKNEELQKKINAIRRQCDSAKELMNQELTGTGGSKEEGEGGIYRELKRQYNDCLVKVNQELNTTQNKQISDLIISNNKKNKQINEKIANLHLINKSLEIGSPSIFEQAVIFHNLAKNNSFIAVINNFMIGLFVFIEICPILAKIFAPYGGYDKAIDYLYDLTKEYYEHQEQYRRKENEKKLASLDTQKQDYETEIIETFWKEVGGRLKYFIAQQLQSIFTKVENSNELADIKKDLIKKLLETTQKEIEKWIEKMKISEKFGKNDNNDN